ncbi:MAG: glycosyltransferase [Parasphingorhabdus sp.]
MGLPAILTAGVAMIATVGLVLLSRSDDVGILLYVAWLSVGSLAVFVGIWQSRELTAKTVFVVALLLHVAAIFGFAVFEDDYFRFIWDGWRLTLTGSPYGVAPVEFFGKTLSDGDLAMTLDGVNNPHLPTIYGPTLQFIFSLAYLLAGTDPVGLRVIFAAINLIMVALLLRWTSPEKAALFAWCPLVLAETIIHIHPDGVMAMLLLAGILIGKRYPLAAGLFFGFAAGAKIVALALWPLLLRMGWRAVASAIGVLALIYGIFIIQGQGAGFDSTGVFASDWYYNPMGFALLDALLPSPIARVSAALIGIGIIMVLHARTRSLDVAPIATIFGAILLFAPAVNAWYLLWILPFAVKERMIWPFAAAVIIPLSYLTGLNLEDPALRDFEVHGLAWAAQVVILLAAVCWDYLRLRGDRKTSKPLAAALTPIAHPEIAIIIPALNEQASIGGVVREIKSQNWPAPPCVIVADNGSTDDTIKQAKAAGAKIVHEPNRGYGAACLAGIAAVPQGTNILLFMDGDGADVPEEGPGLIEPLINGRAELVIGSRALGQKQAGAMTFPQQFGNWLATRLVWLIWGKRMTDLGPYRAIRADALDRLKMVDRDFGWTVEMQVKAVQQDMHIAERPANYRRRIGVSKISGTVRGVVLAGHKILYVIGREAFCR